MPRVSVLFNEPKLLKSFCTPFRRLSDKRFSALQRAEIAEIGIALQGYGNYGMSFSALQRAEIAEILSSVSTSFVM